MPNGIMHLLHPFNSLTFFHSVTPLVLEAFIVRLYREKNKTGFLKAFTDQPEHITNGMSPLKNIMKELQLRTVHIYPR
jgi:DNA excision repair protein ERCC-4